MSPALARVAPYRASGWGPVRSQVVTPVAAAAPEYRYAAPESVPATPSYFQAPTKMSP